MAASDDSASTHSIPLSARLGLALGSLAFLLAGLAGGSIANSTDAVYSVVALDVAGGNWFAPEVADAPYLMKPPLYFWLCAISAKIFGPTALALRLPGVLAAWACVLLGADIGGRLSRSTSGHVAAGLMVLASPTFFEWSRRIYMETLLSAALMAVLWIAVRALDDDRPKLLLWLGPLTAVAVLAKSFAGGFAATAVVVYLAAVGPRRWLSSRWLLAGIAGGGLVLAVWVATMLSVAPEPFVEQTLAPFGLGSEAQFSWYRTGRFYYLTEPFTSDGLVTGAGIAALVIGGIGARTNARLRPLWLLALFVVIGMGVYSQLSQQRLYYLVPFFPVLGVAAGVMIAGLLKTRTLQLVALLAGLVIVPSLQWRAFTPEVVDPSPRERDLGAAVADRLPPDVTVFRYNDFFATTELYLGRRAVQMTPSEVLLQDLSRILVLGERGIAVDGKAPALLQRYTAGRSSSTPFFALFDEPDLVHLAPLLPGLEAWAVTGDVPTDRLYLVSSEPRPADLPPVPLPSAPR